MKNQGTINLNSIVKNSFYALAIAALTFFAVIPAHAADKGKNHPPVEVKYVGSIDDKPVFQIRLDNESGEDLYLSLNDEQGNVLYSDVVKEKKYVRNIQLDNIEENGGFKLNLILRSKKNYATETFQINKNVRFVENVEVTKVK